MSSSYTINIRRIKNKYDINLNMIIEMTPSSILYEGYILNTTKQNIVVIEMIPIKNFIVKDLDYLSLNSKISHPYIIKPIEILHDNSNLYIIYPNFTNYTNLNKIKITNQKEFNKFFNEFRDLIKYILETNLNIESIKLRDIFMKDTIYVIIRFAKNKNNKNNKIEEWGSPIYSPPELFFNKKVLLEEKLLWNFGILLSEILKGSTPYEFCKDIKDIKDIVNFNNLTNPNEIDSFLKLFLEKDFSKRISLLDFFSINIEEHIFFKEEKIKQNKNKEDEDNVSDEIFDMEI